MTPELSREIGLLTTTMTWNLLPPREQLRFLVDARVDVIDEALLSKMRGDYKAGRVITDPEVFETFARRLTA